MRDRTCIAGVGTTAYGKRGEFYERSPVEQVGQALERALDDSGIDRREIDGFATYSVERLDPSFLYTHTYPLERLGDALDATRDRPDGFLKALVTY